MSGKSMNMVKVCRKMPSKGRLEKKFGGTSVDERAIYYINLDNSLCCPKFPCVVPKFPVFSLSGKIDDQIPCFPCAVATLKPDLVLLWREKYHSNYCEFIICPVMFLIFGSVWFQIRHFATEIIYTNIDTESKSITHTLFIKRSQ